MPELLIPMCLLRLHLCSSTIVDWHTCSRQYTILFVYSFQPLVFYILEHISAIFHGHRAQYERVINVLVHDVPAVP